LAYFHMLSFIIQESRSEVMAQAAIPSRYLVQTAKLTVGAPGEAPSSEDNGSPTVRTGFGTVALPLVGGLA